MIVSEKKLKRFLSDIAPLVAATELHRAQDYKITSHWFGSQVVGGAGDKGC